MKKALTAKELVENVYYDICGSSARIEFEPFFTQVNCFWTSDFEPILSNRYEHCSVTSIGGKPWAILVGTARYVDRSHAPFSYDIAAVPLKDTNLSDEQIANYVRTRLSESGDYKHSVFALKNRGVEFFRHRKGVFYSDASDVMPDLGYFKPYMFKTETHDPQTCIVHFSPELVTKMAWDIRRILAAC